MEFPEESPQANQEQEQGIQAPPSFSDDQGIFTVDDPYEKMAEIVWKKE